MEQTGEKWLPWWWWMVMVSTTVGGTITIFLEWYIELIVFGCINLIEVLVVAFMIRVYNYRPNTFDLSELLRNRGWWYPMAYSISAALVLFTLLITLVVGVVTINYGLMYYPSSFLVFYSVYFVIIFIIGSPCYDTNEYITIT